MQDKGETRNQDPSESLSSMELRGNDVLHLRKGGRAGKGVGGLRQSRWRTR